jgi:hypothetical protein
VGSFSSIEQAALTQTTSNARRTQVFAWYHLVGAFATALGALSGGAVAQALQAAGSTVLESYRVMLPGYAGLGLVLGGLFTQLSAAVETTPAMTPATARLFGLHRSRRMVLKLSALFMIMTRGQGP